MGVSRSDDNRTVLDTHGRHVGGEARSTMLNLVVDNYFYLRAEVLDIIVVEAEETEHFSELVGMGLTEI
jgi:hypothetical protein